MESPSLNLLFFTPNQQENGAKRRHSYCCYVNTSRYHSTSNLLPHLSNTCPKKKVRSGACFTRLIQYCSATLYRMLNYYETRSTTPPAPPGYVQGQRSTEVSAHVMFCAHSVRIMNTVNLLQLFPFIFCLLYISRRGTLYCVLCMLQHERCPVSHTIIPDYPGQTRPPAFVQPQRGVTVSTGALCWRASSTCLTETPQ